MKEKKKIKGAETSPSFVLDSSALLTLWNDEVGAEVVEGILRSGKSVYISFMSLMECRYRLWKNSSQSEANVFAQYLELLPLEIIWVTEIIFEKATEIKATNNLSVCDSWIIATAIANQAILIHKDPEFEQVKDQVQLKALHYKSKN
jgi:predicted nucleic acid-binding protein